MESKPESQAQTPVQPKQTVEFQKPVQVAKKEVAAAKPMVRAARGRRFGSAFSSFLFFGVGIGSAFYLSDELSFGAQYIQQDNLLIQNAMQTNSALEWFNFLLNDRNVAAFKIQCFWRERKTRKRYLEIQKSKVYDIKVVTTSLAIDVMQQTDQERIKYILDAMKLRYTWYDLNKPEHNTQELQKLIENYGGPKNVPIVLINGFFIGGIAELQDLVDEGWLIPILEKQYEDQCLMCQVTRESIDDNLCKFCWKKYLFFVKKYKDDLEYFAEALEQNEKQKSGKLKQIKSSSNFNTMAAEQEAIRQMINQRERREEKKSKRSSSIHQHSSKFNLHQRTQQLLDDLQ